MVITPRTIGGTDAFMMSIVTMITCNVKAVAAEKRLYLCTSIVWLYYTGGETCSLVTLVY